MTYWFLKRSISLFSWEDKKCKSCLETNIHWNWIRSPSRQTLEPGTKLERLQNKRSEKSLSRFPFHTLTLVERQKEMTWSISLCGATAIWLGCFGLKFHWDYGASWNRRNLVISKEPNPEHRSSGPRCSTRSRVSSGLQSPWTEWFMA